MGAILPFNVACAGLPAIITLEKIKKQVEGKTRNFEVRIVV